MSTDSTEERLSRMDTCWTRMNEAHDGPEEKMRAARNWLVERYAPVARRYLLGVMSKIEALRKQTEIVNDLTQDFVGDLLSGKFQGAKENKGRFRDYLRTSLRNMVFRQLNRTRQQPQTLAEDVEAGNEYVLPEEEEVTIWREELISQAFRCLERKEAAENPKRVLHTVLRLRTKHANMTSQELAAKVEKEVGVPFTGGRIRRCLHDARRFLEGCLVSLVAATLKEPTVDRIEEELFALGLYEYCQEEFRELAHAKVPFSLPECTT